MKKRVSGAWVGPATAPWAPLATLETDYATEAEADAAYAPLAYGTFVRRVFQTLTDKTSFAGTGAEQWGTEQATLDDALLPKTTGVTVYAKVDGYWINATSQSTLVIVVEISLDGGSTWSTSRQKLLRDSEGAGAGSAGTRQDAEVDHQVTGTVTGDIQARAMATCGAGSGTPYDLLNGAISMEVLVNP